MKKFVFVIVILFGLIFPERSYAAKRGLWLWFTTAVVSSNNEVNILINQCLADNISDIYMYAPTSFLTNATNKTNTQNFISKATCNGIRVWALDGYRAYFSDWSGPSAYYTFINTVINYNSASAANQRFVGVHGDNEPNDGQGEPKASFHNDITDSGLSTVAGSGVWQSTQKLDREFLMRDWITITQTAYNTCHANSLLYGQAMPSWLDDYYGETIKCTYNSIYQPVYYHMMQYLDDYCIMSYRTTPAQLIARVTGELSYAATLPAASRPHVWAGVETHCGVGSGVSYCDTPGKNSKAAVWADVATIEATLNTYVSYTGMNIHDWNNTGYKELPSASSNTANPGCSSLPVELVLLTGNNVGASNLIEWTTVTEVNNQKFELQKSRNGISFETIAEIDGAGNSNATQEYSYRDAAPNYEGISYYRLKQSDLDGAYSYSKIISVSSEISSIVSIYPNPAKDRLHVLLGFSSGTNINIQIYNSNGMLCYSSELTTEEGNSISIDITNFIQAVYFVKVQSRDNSFSLSKAIQVY